MSRTSGWRCALWAAAVLAISSNATKFAHADEKSAATADEVGEQRFSVAGLVPTAAAASELEELCVGLVEPSSWEQAGGTGKIKAGRASVTVTNTKRARDGVRTLIAALRHRSQQGIKTCFGEQRGRGTSGAGCLQCSRSGVGR